MGKIGIEDLGRRRFLQAAPVAAAAGLALGEGLLGKSAEAQSAPGEPFQLFTAKKIEDDQKELEAKPGNVSLVEAKGMPFTMVLTTEKAKSAKEFEWHEGRDHVLQVLEGTTVYELGGRPKEGRNTKPGEWLAPASEGAETVTLRKGDILVIPRGTPHKRSTAGSVTFTLISPMGSAVA